MSIRTILFASALACLGAVAGQQSAAHAQPVMPPPPSPAYVPPAQPAQGYPAQAQPAQAYPPPAQPAQGYPPPAQPAPAYPAPQQQPAPAPQQPQGYPPPQQPASAYPQPGQTYPPQQPQGYPPPQGYPAPQQPQGYPPQQQPQGYPPPQQPQGYPPPPVAEAAPPPPPPEAEVESESVFANPLSKLQVGFHLGMGSLDTSENATYSSDLTSLGIFVRYRFTQRWEAELAVASESGTIEANNAVRDFTPITASGLFHVIDLRGVDVYGRAGLGRGTEVYDNPLYDPLEGSTTHFHIGAGASYIFRRNIAAGVEMRWNRIARGDSDDLSRLTGSGTMYSLYGAYHF